MILAIRDLENVFVTDHSPKPKRLHTNSEAEDEDFYAYEQKLKDFHTSSPHALLKKDQEDFEHPAKKLIEKEFQLRMADEGEDSEEGDEDEEPVLHISE